MAAEFLVQRLHPRLLLGYTLRAADGRRARLYCRQGEFDGACGLNCAAMMLALLDYLPEPTLISTAKKGAAAKLWQLAKPTFFDGINEYGLAELLGKLDLDLSVKPFSGTHAKTTAFVLKNIDRGGLVITGWRTADKKAEHWVLAVGTEGPQIGKSYRPQVLLVLDASLPEPTLCGYNGRLHLAGMPPAKDRRFVQYVTNDGCEFPVTLTSAVAIRRSAS